MDNANKPRFPRRAAVSLVTLFAAAASCATAVAGVMHSDASIITYADFGQNLGRYTTASNALLESIRASEGGIRIYYTGGQESYVLEHGLIDFGSTGDNGAFNAIGNNFIATVAHNGVQNPTFTGRYIGESNAIHYATIEYRNSGTFSLSPDYDYKIARTSKLITDVTGATIYSGNVSNLSGSLLYRAGAGTMQLADHEGNITGLAGAYAYIIGGIVKIGSSHVDTSGTTDERGITQDKLGVVYQITDYGPEGISAEYPLPTAIRGGDSGSPSWIWNGETGQYEYLAAGQAMGGNTYYLKGATQWTIDTMASFDQTVELTAPSEWVTINAVNETREDETISETVNNGSEVRTGTPTYGTVTDENGTKLAEFIGVKSGLNTWLSLSDLKDAQNWYAYGNAYLNSEISYTDLYLTENLVFNAARAETTINVGADVDLGLGYVEFTAGTQTTAKFTISSENNYRLNSAGYVVGAGVDLYVTISNTDADYMREWRKIGDGNLHIEGSGNNEIFLNVGGNGATYLNQSDGYAAYNVIANNGATVSINDVNQIARDFTFGYGGGLLDMNGNSMAWKLTNDDVPAEGFTINALTEEAIITNLKSGTTTTLTYTEGGETTFKGSFSDTTVSALNIVANAGADSVWTLNSIYTHLQNAGSGLDVQSGKVVLAGTNTVHGTGSATGTNTNRYFNENDWHYADATMNVAVANGATFTLGSHARLTGNVTIAAGGTFVMNEGVKHRYEYIEGGIFTEDTYAIADYYGLKGNVALGDGATMSVKFSEGTTANTTYAGNITGTGNVSVELGTAGGTLTLSGENTFSGTKTLTSGGLIAETSAALGNVADNKWIVGEQAFFANKENPEDLLQFVDGASMGVLALTADRATQLDLSSHQSLIIGALDGTTVNYGAAGTSEELTAYNGSYTLGGGGGELVVNFKLTGENNLVLGNGYGKGTVTLNNSANDFTGTTTLNGQITLKFVDGVLGNSTLVLPYTNRVFVGETDLPTLASGANGVLLVDNRKSSDIDISGENYSGIYLGSAGDKTLTSVTIADTNADYRFGGVTGTLTIAAELKNSDSTTRNLIVDGQTYSGGKVVLAQAATFTGDVTVVGYDSTKTNLTEGDITLSLGADNALASASSVNVGVGGILDLAGTTQTLNAVTLAANGAIIDSALSGKLSVESGSLVGSLALAHLEKFGSDTTLTIGGNAAVSVVDVLAGTLAIAENSRPFYASTRVNISNGATFAIGAQTMDAGAYLSAGATATLASGGNINGSLIAVGGGTATLSGTGTVSGSIGAASDSTLILTGGTLTLTGDSVNETGGVVSLQSSQLTVGGVESLTFGGTLSIDADATLYSNRDGDNSKRDFAHIHVANGKTLTIDDATWNTIWNIDALSGEGDVVWNSDTTHWYSSRIILDGAGDLSGAFTFNRNNSTEDRPYQAFLELAHDNALANASSLNLTGANNSYASLAINAGDVHLNGLNGNEYTHLYAGTSVVGNGKSSKDDNPDLATAPTSSRDATLTLTGSGTYTFAGTVAGDETYALSLVKDGAGTQTFSGAATFKNISALQGTLTLSAATVLGDISLGAGATLNFNSGENAVYTLSSGKTFSVVAGNGTESATFNGTLALDGGTLGISGHALSSDFAALTLGGLSLGENAQVNIALSDTSALIVGKTYRIANQDWSAASFSENYEWEYLTGTVSASTDGLSLTIGGKSGFVIWNGTSEQSAWSDSAFGQNAALAETDVAVFNDTADSKAVSLGADVSVAGMIFDTTQNYKLSGEHTISAGYLTVHGGGNVTLAHAVNLSGDLSVAQSSLILNGNTAVAGNTSLAGGATLGGNGTLTTETLSLAAGETTTFDGINASVATGATFDNRRFLSSTKTETTLNFLNGAILDDRNSYYGITGTLNLNGDETSGGTLYVNGLRLSDNGDVQSRLNVGENVHLVITGTGSGQTGSFGLSHWGSGLRNSNLRNTVNVAGTLTSNAVISAWDTGVNINIVSGGTLNLLAGLSRNTDRSYNVTLSVDEGGTLNAAGGTRQQSLGINLKEGSTLGGIASTVAGTATFTNHFALGSSNASNGNVTIDTDIRTVSDFMLTEGTGGTVEISGDIEAFGNTGINVAGSGTLRLSGSVDVAGINVENGATLELAGTTNISDYTKTFISNAGTLALGEAFVLALSGETEALKTGITAKIFENTGTLSGEIRKDDVLWNGKHLGGRAEFSYDETSGTVTVSGAVVANLIWNGGDAGTWNTTDENFVFEETGENSRFYDYDSVIFKTEGANVTLASETIRAENLKIEKTLTLTAGEGASFSAESVVVESEQNLTIAGEGGSVSLSNISGAGTLNVSGTLDTLTLSGGSVNISGTETTITTLNNAATLNVSSGTNAFTTLEQATGSLTISGGTNTIDTLSTSGGNVTLSGGTTEIYVANQTSGVFTLSGGTLILGSDDFTGSEPTGTIYLSLAEKSLSGNLTLKGGAKAIVGAGADALNYDGRNTITVATGGELYFDSARWTVRANNKIVLSGGKITGTGQSSYGALDFYGSGNILTATGGVESTIEAPIRLRNALTIAVGDETDSASSLVVSGTILGGNGLTKTGAGTLTLSGANTYSGGTTISGGKIVATNASALGTNTVTNNAELELNFSGTLGNTISGTGTLLVSGGEVALSSGAKTLSGNIVVGENAVVWGTVVDAINYDNSSDGIVTVRGVLNLGNNTEAETPSGVRWSFGAYNKLVLDGGTVRGSGDGNGYALDFFAANTVRVTADSEIAANMAIRGNNTNLAVEVDSGVTLTISGNLVACSAQANTENAPFEKAGAGKIIFSGAKSNGAALKISGGELVAQSNLGAGAITVTGETSVLKLESAMALNSENAAITLADGATLDVASIQTGAGADNAISVTSGTGTYRHSAEGEATLSGDANISLAAGTELIVDVYHANASLNIEKTITGGESETAKIIKDGAGTLILKAANRIGGGKVKGGKVAAMNAGAFGSGEIVFENDAALELLFSGEMSNKLSGAGTVSVNTTGTVTLSGDNSGLTRGVSVLAGTLNASGTALGGGAASVASGATLALGNSVSLYGAIQNAGTVSIASGTTFALDNLSVSADAANVYALITATGTNSSVEWSEVGFTQNSASVDNARFDGANVLVGAGTLTWAGENSATWSASDAAAKNWTIVSGGGKVNYLDGDSVIFATADADVSVSGTVAPANITVSENVTFSGENYTVAATGTLTIAADKTLALSGSGTLSGAIANSGTITVGADSVLNVASASNFGTVTGSGRVNLASSVSVGETFKDSANWTGTVTFTSLASNTTIANFGNENSTIEIGDFNGYWADENGGTIASDLVLTGEVVLSDGWGAGTLTVDGDISGAGTFTFSRDVTQKLIFNGNVELSSMAFTSGGGQKTFNGNTDIGAFSVAAGTVNFSGTGTHTIGTLNVTAGSIAGNGTITLLNDGTLAGSNGSFTGQFIVEGGTLRLNSGSGTLGSTDNSGTGTRYAAVVKTGGTLDINGKTNGGNNCYKIELAGGSLVNNGPNVGTGQRQITGLKLSADSEIGGSGEFGLIANGHGATNLELGGNTLTKTGGNTFHLVNATVSEGTIKVAAGTLAISTKATDASAADFVVEGGSLVVNDNFSVKNLSVSEGGNVKFGGVSFTLGSTIENTGTISLNSGMVFHLDNLTATNNVYTLISGTGTITGWDALSASNFKQNGSALSQVRKATNSYSVLVGNGTLTWGGDANGAGTWNETDANWTIVNGGDKFTYVSGDSVIFATADADVSVSGTVAPADITVSENVTFSGENYTVAATGTLTVAADKTLALSGSGTLALTSFSFGEGTISVGENAVLEQTTATAGVSSTQISGTGTVKVALTDDLENDLNLGSSFTGETYVTSGKFDISDAVVGTTLRLANGVVAKSSVGGGATVSANIILEGENTIHANSGKALTYSGSVTGENGVFVSNGTSSHTFNGNVVLKEFKTANTATVNFNGGVSLDALTISHGATFNIASDGNIKTLNQTAGTLTISGGTNTISELNQTAGTLAISGGETILHGGTANSINFNGTGGSLTFSASEDSASAEFSVSEIKTTTKDNYARNITIAESATVNAKTFTNAWGMGTLTVNGELNVSESFSFATGNNNSTETNIITGSGIIKTEKFIVGNVGTYNVNGGIRIEIGGGAFEQTDNGPGKKLNLGDATLGVAADWTNVTRGFSLVSEDIGTTIDTMENSAVLSGELSGSGKLLKTGAGTLVLSGGNTYSGGTTISGGVLQVDSLGWGNKGNLGTMFTQNGLILKTGGVLNVTKAQNADTTNAYGNGGALRGFSVTTGAGTYRYSGTGTSHIAHNTASDANNQHVGLADGAELILDVVRDDATLELTKVIANTTETGTDATTGSLTKTGAGTLVLGATEAHFSGGVKVEQGVLEIANAAAVGTGGVSVDSGAALQFSVLNSTVQGGVKLASGAQILVDLADFSETISAGNGNEVMLTILTGTTLTFGSDAVQAAYTLLRETTTASDYYATKDSSNSFAQYTNRDWAYNAESGTLTLTLSIPEPSAFGLLAGLSALALVVSRRRRK